jgi:hypothetical protein
MKTKCPHCRFKFDTDEKLSPKFKIGQKIRFVKSKMKKYLYHGFNHCKDFSFTGKVINYKLCRAGTHTNGNRDSWTFNVEYLPYSKRDGTTSIWVWEQEIYVCR